jgi:GntR family transcriptional regulator/MocR family aminotransferase
MAELDSDGKSHYDDLKGATLKRVHLQISLDRTGCLHRQVREALCRAIVQGDLLPGQRLPSTRALARHLGVSRNTVMYAYEDLASSGLIAGTVGSGTRVRGKAPRPRRLDPREIVAAAHYPAAVAAFCDPDGNRLRLQG